MKVKITKAPIGRFKLAYFINDTPDLPKELAEELIKEGYAEPAGKEAKKVKLTATSKAASKRKKR